MVVGQRVVLLGLSQLVQHRPHVQKIYPLLLHGLGEGGDFQGGVRLPAVEEVRVGVGEIGVLPRHGHVVEVSAVPLHHVPQLGQLPGHGLGLVVNNRRVGGLIGVEAQEHAVRGDHLVDHRAVEQVQVGPGGQLHQNVPPGGVVLKDRLHAGGEGAVQHRLHRQLRRAGQIPVLIVGPARLGPDQGDCKGQGQEPQKTDDNKPVGPFALFHG